MKTGIFETEHFEAVYPVIRLLDTADRQLVIFTTVECQRQLQHLLKQDAQRYEWVILPINTGRLGFFQALYQQAKTLEFFFINTISGNHLLFAMLIALLRNTRVVITVHDINCLFNPPFSVLPRRFVQYVGKRMLTSVVKEFNVISDTMIGSIPGNKIVHNIPGSIFEKEAMPAPLPLHVVVPGSIDKKRRDYEQVFALAEKMPELRITLLGGTRDADVIQQAKAFSNIRVYETHLVEQAEFDAQMARAHFLFIPSVIHTSICDGIPEIYGVTKSSGNIFDAVRHAKPMIIPQELRIPANLEPGAFRYNSISDVVSFLNEVDVLQWHLRAVKDSTQYTIARLRERNQAILG